MVENGQKLDLKKLEEVMVKGGSTSGNNGGTVVSGGKKVTDESCPGCGSLLKAPQEQKSGAGSAVMLGGGRMKIWVTVGAIVVALMVGGL